MKKLLTIVILLTLARAAPGQPDPVPAAGSEEAAPIRIPGVVVTARKWLESVLDVPQSVTVVTDRTVREAGIRSMRDAAFHVPNMALVEFNARRLSFPFVRGIGSGQGEPAVTTYLDGVPLLFGSSTNLPLLNVERIEFLRGPQGTLYGRNSLGGLMHVFTRPPPALPEIGAELTSGSYDLRRASLTLGAPLVDDVLSLGLAGLLVKRDGFTKNKFTGQAVDDRDTRFGQGQLLFTPDEKNEFRLSVLAERTRDGGFALTDLGRLRGASRSISQDFDGVTERDVFLPSLTWRHEGDRIDMVSITSFQGFEVLETSDFDFSELDGVRRRAKEESESLLQEFRVSSPAGAPVALGDGVELRWLAGALVFTSDSERSAANEFRPDGVGIVAPVAGIDESTGDFRDRGLGLFGQATVTLLEDLQVGAGLRYDREEKDARLRRTFTSGGVPLSGESGSTSESYDEVLPRFDVGWRASGDLRVYAFAARGFKAGGFNLDAPEGLIPFSPETSWTFEVGAKAELLDGRLRFSAAFFLIDWDDMQLSRFDATVGGYVTNAGEATSRGFELELAARPAEGLDVFATCGLTDAEFDSYTDPYGIEVGGNKLPFAPTSTWSAGAQWSADLGSDLRLRLRGEYAAVGTFHYDAGNLKDESFGLANFRAGIGGTHWRLDVFVRNAFDRDYVPVAFQPNPADPTMFVGERGAPRTFGVTLSVDF